jgi:hypothetical protein
MDGTEKTIQFLRGLTLDGILTGEEVWGLGKFFMDNPECAQSWPGEVLEPMLESAFDDSSLTDEEMVLIAQTISSIEEEWRSKNPASAREEDESEPVQVKPALIPVIDVKFEIPAREAESYIVGLKEHTCTCSDWTPRKPLPARHPGKCCKHVAHAFTRTGKVFEPWFQALLDDCFAHGRGTNPSTDWHLLALPTKPALLGGSSGPWWNVFAPANGVYGKYAFNSKDWRWSFGDSPEKASLIERAIRDHLSAAP